MSKLVATGIAQTAQAARPKNNEFIMLVGRMSGGVNPAP